MAAQRIEPRMKNCPYCNAELFRYAGSGQVIRDTFECGTYLAVSGAWIQGKECTARTEETQDLLNRAMKALAIIICEHTECHECSQDAEHCEEVREEMQRRLADAGK